MNRVIVILAIVFPCFGFESNEGKPLKELKIIKEVDSVVWIEHFQDSVLRKNIIWKNSGSSSLIFQWHAYCGDGAKGYRIIKPRHFLRPGNMDTLSLIFAAKRESIPVIFYFFDALGNMTLKITNRFNR